VKALAVSAGAVFTAILFQISLAITRKTITELMVFFIFFQTLCQQANFVWPQAAGLLTNKDNHGGCPLDEENYFMMGRW